MVEQVYIMSSGDKKVTEKVLFDENLHYLHVILEKNDFLPEHFSNSTVYMTIVRGKLSIALDDFPMQEYDASTMLKIPFKTKMNVQNKHDSVLELIIVKAPAPKA